MAERQVKIEELTIEEASRHFVDSYISTEVRNGLILKAFQEVDRGDFVPEEGLPQAYVDKIIPLGDGSSISQPSLVAKMLDFANLDGTGKLLELGTASGYYAAIMSKCSEEVHTVEYNPDLAESAAWLLSELGHKNIFVHLGDGLAGVP